jgi:hypothetical protein
MNPIVIHHTTNHLVDPAKIPNPYLTGKLKGIKTQNIMKATKIRAQEFVQANLPNSPDNSTRRNETSTPASSRTETPIFA